MKRGVKLGTRIMLGFGNILLIVAILIVISISNLYLIHSKLNEVTVNAEKVKLGNIIKQSMLII
ncbi:MAG: hypothetical protein ACM3X9_08240, partial [Bacillota bacterium]